MSRIILLTLLLLTTVTTSRLSAQTLDSAARERVGRLAAIARLWGHVKYFHPTLPDRNDIDWDATLIEAIAKVRAAGGSAEYHTAARAMVSPLNDPLTRVISAATETSAASPFAHRLTRDSTLIITMGDYIGLASPAVQQSLQEAQTALRSARAVVIDLRAFTPTENFGRAMLLGSLAGFERMLTSDTLPLPGERRRVYYGYDNPGPFSSGQYRTGHFVRSPARLIPARAARPVPAVFVINEHSIVTPGVLALQHAGRAQLLYEGELGHHNVGESEVLELADSLRVRVRTSLAVFPDGRSGALIPNTVIEQRNDRAAAIERALVALRAAPSAAQAGPVLPQVMPLPLERSYPAMTAPSVEYRLLALFRFWNVIEYFFPYKDLLDHDWSAVLEEFIPVFEQAEGERAYTLAVARLATRIQDSHAYVSGRGFEKHVIGSGYPALRIRMIEDQLVVTALYDSTVARAGISVGDILLRVDDEDARARLQRFAQLVAASTPQDSVDKATEGFLTGEPGSTVKLTVQRRSNQEAHVLLQRRAEDFTTLYHRERSGDIVRILDGNIGYIDLDRFTLDMVDSTFNRLKHTRGIIFDMRGYPRGTIWAIAPRLTRTAKRIALYHTPMQGHQSQGVAMESFFQMLEPSDPALHYDRPTVMLMDERSVSQAEHTGLYLRAANGTRFVGSRTAGANGELATLQLPGGITVGFTGQAVSHPDGRQLQRIGLIPDVEVKPTIAGIRSGRDEVLDAAVRLITEP